jgi:hypothetical protein
MQRTCRNVRLSPIRAQLLRLLYQSQTLLRKIIYRGTDGFRHYYGQQMVVRSRGPQIGLMWSIERKPDGRNTTQ